MKLDRRAMACALTFSLKMPYIAIPAGFGLIFQGIIADNMTKNGMPVQLLDVWKSTWFLGFAMFVGLLIAVLFSYRKDREYQDLPLKGIELEESDKMELKHWLTLIAALAAFVVQQNRITTSWSSNSFNTYGSIWSFKKMERH